MKQIFGVLLLSMGIYAFSAGIYLGRQAARLEDVRHIAHPQGAWHARAEADPVRRHSMPLLFACATAATLGVGCGLQLLLQGRKKPTHSVRTPRSPRRN